jgi:hypothetical protein
MNISNLLKSTKTVEIQGKKLTVKKFPLGFFEYLQSKSQEGKQFNYEDGKLQNVNMVFTPKYDLEETADQLFYGLESWDLIDDQGYAIPLTRENTMTVVTDYPDFSKEILKAVIEINSPVISGELKKKSPRPLKT